MRSFLVLTMDPPEKALLMHPKTNKGRFFGTATARVPIIRKLMSLGLVEHGGYHEKYGTPRWNLTKCGMNASQLLREVNETPLLKEQVIQDYEARRSLCPKTIPDPPRKFPLFRNNPRAKKLKKREQIKQRIKGWIDHRIDLQKPISYRFFNRLIESYVTEVGMAQQDAINDFRECGIDRILIPGPPHPSFPLPSDEFHPVARWMWDRRDLRPNPYRRNSDEETRNLERAWQQGDIEAGERLQRIKERTDPFSVEKTAQWVSGGTPSGYIMAGEMYCDDCGEAILQEMHKEDPENFPIRCVYCHYVGPVDILDRDNANWILCPECGDHSASFDNEDSEGMPVYFTGSDSTDSITHCGSHGHCVNAIQVGWKIGGQPFLIGAWISFGLTEDGINYLVENIQEDPHNNVIRLWAHLYSDNTDIQAAAEQAGILEP